MGKRACKICSVEFEPTYSCQLTCSVACRNKAKSLSKTKPLFPRACETCGTNFTSKKKGKKYCSHDCYAKRHGTVTKTCETCSKVFTVAYRFRTQKTCGLECAKTAIAKTLTTAESRDCSQCSKQFTRNQYELKNGARYCSQVCFHEAHRRELVCPVCSKPFIVYASVADERECCSKSCAHSGENNAMHGMSGALNPMFGKPAWCRGLTTKTDDRLRVAGEKISNVISDKIVNGEWTHPMGFDSGWHESLKAGWQFHRSSYEKRYFEMLDSDPDVVTYQSEPFNIPYLWEGSVKNYTPDILVTRRDRKQLIEVKPVSLVNEPKNIAKATAADVWCSQNSVEYVVVTENELPIT